MFYGLDTSEWKQLLQDRLEIKEEGLPFKHYYYLAGSNEGMNE